MKVLIVDDGHYIVEYLKHLLDWSKFGVDQVETTTNSIEARQMLEQSPADILITDIRMPEVSGIDLLEHVGVLKLKTKVIFLSGYSEFEYAQKAVRLGAFDYLLKPVDKDDMEKAIQKVTEAIGESRPEEGVSLENVDGLGYLLSFICGNGSPIQEAPTGMNGFEHEPMRFFRLSPADGGEEMKLRDFLKGKLAFIWATSSSLSGVVPESECETLAAVFPGIAMSETFQSTQKDRVRHPFYRFFYKEETASADVAMLQEWSEFSKLESGEWECARHQIQKRFPRLAGRKQQIIYLVEAAHYLYMANDKVSAEEVQGWLFDRMERPEDVYESLLFALSRLGRDEDMPGEDIVHTVRTYIAGHLDEALSLDDLGRIVHLHPVYLSKFYKQQTGENLSSYIALKRLERASRLLIDSNLHVVDISRMVGYKKPQYFIKLFKEQYGITPQQYRKKRIKS
ncbi:putative response regulatory protein [compost metagenome]